MTSVAVSPLAVAAAGAVPPPFFSSENKEGYHECRPSTTDFSLSVCAQSFRASAHCGQPTHRAETMADELGFQVLDGLDEIDPDNILSPVCGPSDCCGSIGDIGSVSSTAQGLLLQRTTHWPEYDYPCDVAVAASDEETAHFELHTGFDESSEACCTSGLMSDGVQRLTLPTSFCPLEEYLLHDEELPANAVEVAAFAPVQRQPSPAAETDASVMPHRPREPSGPELCPGAVSFRAPSSFAPPAHPAAALLMATVLTQQACRRLNSAPPPMPADRRPAQPSALNSANDSSSREREPTAGASVPADLPHPSMSDTGLLNQPDLFLSALLSLEAARKRAEHCQQRMLVATNFGSAGDDSSLTTRRAAEQPPPPPAAPFSSRMIASFLQAASSHLRLQQNSLFAQQSEAVPVPTTTSQAGQRATGTCGSLSVGLKSSPAPGNNPTSVTPTRTALPSSFAPSAATSKPKRRKRRSKTDEQGRGRACCCLVDNCVADLSKERPYCRRYKLCSNCIHRDSMLVDAKESRFCQQCSLVHNITAFDGAKRSCREKLQQHAQRVRLSRLRRAAKAAC